MGYNTVPVYGNSGTEWYPRISMGNTTLNFELWDATKQEDLNHFYKENEMLFHSTAGTFANVGLFMPAYANTKIKGKILQHWLTLRDDDTAVQFFDMDGSANATSCTHRLSSANRKLTCDEAFNTNNGTVPGSDFTCSNICERPDQVNLCDPWPVSAEELARFGGKCPACCTHGKYYTKLCRAAMTKTGAHTSSSPCIEVLYPGGGADLGYFESAAENLQLPFVFSYLPSYAAVEVEMKKRIDAGRLFLAYWWGPEPLLSYSTDTVKNTSRTFIPLILPVSFNKLSTAPVR